MGLITKLIKVGAPGAAVYYSVENHLWDPAVGSPEAEKQLERSLNQINHYRHQADEKIEPYRKQMTESMGVSLPKNIPNLTCAGAWYNCAVKTTIKSIADFDGKQALDKISKLLATPPQSTEKKVAV
ncbi:hypothetical protein HDE_02193 [Halotydeus destructor]|nr:hypothetical protein HDE_02193 [Halotydeus destructor]